MGYVIHLLKMEKSHWAQRMVSYMFSPKQDDYSEFLPHRIQGRPYLRWDDNIQKLCDYHYPDSSQFHWSQSMTSLNAIRLENAYIDFVHNSLI